jgi:hypothetical protein
MRQLTGKSADHLICHESGANLAGDDGATSLPERICATAPTELTNACAALGVLSMMGEKETLITKEPVDDRRTSTARSAHCLLTA